MVHENTYKRHIDGENSTMSELSETHRNIMLYSARLKLLGDLLEMGLCTRDVYSFACKQIDLCATLMNPDWSTVRSAMKLKIRDLNQLLKEEHRKRRKKERELLEEFNGNSWKVRRKIKLIKRSIRKEKIEIENKYRRKKEHYKKTQERLCNINQSEKENSENIETEGRPYNSTVIPTVPPKSLEEFSTMTIFDSPEDFVKPQPPLGPFVTSRDIKLTKGERKLLSRDPKFSIIYPPTKMKMSIEIERMNSKARYDLGAKEKKKKKMRVEAVTDHKTGDCKDKKVEDMSLLEIFDKCKDRFVFNPLENSINFAQRKP